MSTTKELLKEFNGARLYKRSGILVLHVKGSPYECGRAHGELLREEIKKSNVLDFFETLIQRLLRHSPFDSFPNWLKKAGEHFIEHQVVRKLALQHFPEVTEELKGLAEGLNIPVERLLRLYILPDVLSNLFAWTFGRRERVTPFNLLGACTSLSAWGKATADGSLICGRNLDFWGVGIWDKFPLITFCEPEKGLSFCSISTPGFALGGLTGLNSASLSVALHLNFSKGVSISGAPIFNITHSILKNAKNIEEAEKIVSKHKICGSFSIFLTEGKTKQACVLEIDANGKSIRKPKDSYLCQTNHYISPARREAEMDFSTSFRMNSVARFIRCKEWLKESWGRLSVPDFCHFLGDHYDVFLKKERPIGNIITQPICIQSVVFKPETHELWVASGEAPASHGEYIGFNLNKEIKEVKASAPHSYSGNSFRHTKAYSAYLHYIEAYKSYFYEEDTISAIREIEFALELESEEPTYYLVSGLLWLKLKKYLQTINFLEEGLKYKDTLHKEAVFHLWLGRAYDLMGQRETALSYYAKALNNPEAGRDVSASARKGLYKVYQEKKIAYLDVDFIFGDTFFY